MDPAKISILVIDHDSASARRIVEPLAAVGYEVSHVPRESAAFSLATGEPFNVVVKSSEGRRSNALALMESVRAIAPDTQFIFISDQGTIHTAVDAMRKGAFDYLVKPLDTAQLIESVAKALDYQSVVAEDQRIKQRLRRRSKRTEQSSRSDRRWQHSASRRPGPSSSPRHPSRGNRHRS